MRLVSLSPTNPLSLLTRHAPASDVADPNLECTPYYYAPSGQFVNDFPTVWQPATLLAKDTEGQALWAKIEPSIPTNIQPKRQLGRSTDYDWDNDPDCCKLLFQPRHLIRG